MEDSSSTSSFGLGQSILRGAAIMAAIHLLSRGLGLVREVLFTSHFGATEGTDAFFVAELFCVFLPLLLGESLAALLIPLFSRMREQGEEETAWQVSGSVATLSAVTMLTLGAGLVYLSPYLLPWLYRFPPSTYAYFHIYLPYFWPLMTLLVLIQIGVAIYESHRHFTLGATYFLWLNMGIIGAILLFAPSGVVAAVWGYLAGGLFSFLLLWGGLWHRRKGRRLFFWHWSHPELWRLLRLLVPLFLAKCAYVLLTLVDQLFASTLPQGSLSALNYGYLISFLLPSFSILALQRAVFPTLCDHAQRKEPQKGAELLERTLVFLAFCLFPFSLYLYLFSTPVVSLFFERGAFGGEATAMSAAALEGYALGMASLAASEMVKTAFFAFENTKTPFYTQLFLVVLNILLNALLIHLWQLKGLALASSLAEWCVLLLLLYWLHKSYLPLRGLWLFKVCLGLVVCATLGGAASVGVYALWGDMVGFFPRLFALLSAWAVGLSLYMALTFLFRLPPTIWMGQVWKERIRPKLPL